MGWPAINRPLIISPIASTDGRAGENPPPPPPPLPAGAALPLAGPQKGEKSSIAIFLFSLEMFKIQVAARDTFSRGWKKSAILKLSNGRSDSDTCSDTFSRG